MRDNVMPNITLISDLRNYIRGRYAIVDMTAYEKTQATM
jgi:hypothetical protein